MKQLKSQLESKYPGFIISITDNYIYVCEGQRQTVKGLIEWFWYNPSDKVKNVLNRLTTIIENQIKMNSYGCSQ